MRVVIFTEDRYGIGFIRRIINRLIKEGYINQKIEFPKTNTPSLIRKCNNVGRKVKSVVKDVDRILIIIDKENVREYDENKAIWQHLEDLKEKDKEKVRVIATEPEIEEWICISLGLEFDKTGEDKDRKPSKVLEEKCGYRKKMLPRYADKLDFNKLLNKSESFRKFVESLKQ